MGIDVAKFAQNFSGNGKQLTDLLIKAAGLERGSVLVIEIGLLTDEEDVRLWRQTFTETHDAKRTPYSLPLRRTDYQRRMQQMRAEAQAQPHNPTARLWP